MMRIDAIMRLSGITDSQGALNILCSMTYTYLLEIDEEVAEAFAEYQENLSIMMDNK